MTREYLERMEEAQRRFNEAAAPLVEKLCESYDTERKVKLEIPTKDLIETIVMTYDNEMIERKAADKKLEQAWVSSDEVRIDFTGDFHCAIRMEKGDSIEMIAHKLMSMGQNLLEVYHNDK